MVKPWLGAWTYTFPPAGLPSAAMYVGLSGIFLIVVAFYLNHCVVDQPLWAVAAGWAPMVSGLTLVSLQSAFGAWWVSVDIDHAGFPLAYCEMSIGAAVVAASWLLEPELFNPSLRRLWVASIVGASVLAFALLGRNGLTVAVVAAVVITVALLIAGTRAQWHKTEPASAPAASGPPRRGLAPPAADS